MDETKKTYPTVRAAFRHINDELESLRAAVLAVDGSDEGYRNLDNDFVEIAGFLHDYQGKEIAEAAARTVAAITKMVEDAGVDGEVWQETLKRVAKELEK